MKNQEKPTWDYIEEMKAETWKNLKETSLQIDN